MRPQAGCLWVHRGNIFQLAIRWNISFVVGLISRIIIFCLVDGFAVFFCALLLYVCACLQAGYIRTNKNEYLIEPSKNHKVSGGHPHVVFHRSAVKGSHETDKKGAQKKRKKKRKRRHHSNCGTKEPRPSAETKIEWQPQGKVRLFSLETARINYDYAKRQRKRRMPWRQRMFFVFMSLHIVFCRPPRNPISLLVSLWIRKQISKELYYRLSFKVAVK